MTFSTKISFIALLLCMSTFWLAAPAGAESIDELRRRFVEEMAGDMDDAEWRKMAEEKAASMNAAELKGALEELSVESDEDRRLKEYDRVEALKEKIDAKILAPHQALYEHIYKLKTLLEDKKETFAGGPKTFGGSLAMVDHFVGATKGADEAASGDLERAREKLVQANNDGSAIVWPTPLVFPPHTDLMTELDQLSVQVSSLNKDLERRLGPLRQDALADSVCDSEGGYGCVPYDPAKAKAARARIKEEEAKTTEDMKKLEAVFAAKLQAHLLALRQVFTNPISNALGAPL